MSNPADPVAEMKARAEQFLTNECNWDPTGAGLVVSDLAAFAAKEVERVTRELSVTAEQLGKAVLFNSERAEKAEQALLRATEAERLENAKALCEYCGGNGLFGQDVQAAKRDKNGIWWHYTGRPDCKIQCDAAPIWERARGKNYEHTGS